MIITQQQIDEEQQERHADDAKWQAVYDSDPAVRELADGIHRSRMLAGPACTQCIETAVIKLHAKTEASKGGGFHGSQSMS